MSPSNRLSSVITVCEGIGLVIAIAFCRSRSNGFNSKRATKFRKNFRTAVCRSVGWCQWDTAHKLLQYTRAPPHRKSIVRSSDRRGASARWWARLVLPAKAGIQTRVSCDVLPICALVCTTDVALPGLLPRAFAGARLFAGVTQSQFTDHTLATPHHSTDASRPAGPPTTPDGASEDALRRVGELPVVNGDRRVLRIDGGCQAFGDATRQCDALIRVLPVGHVRMFGEPGEQPAVPDAGFDFCIEVPVSQPIGDGGRQFVEAASFPRANNDAFRVQPAEDVERCPVFDGVGFVEHKQRVIALDGRGRSGRR